MFSDFDDTRNNTHGEACENDGFNLLHSSMQQIALVLRHSSKTVETCAYEIARSDEASIVPQLILIAAELERLANRLSAVLAKDIEDLD